MTTLYDYFPNSKNSSLGLKFEVIEEPEKINTNLKFKVRCLDCKVEFLVSAKKIFIGQLPCACGKTFARTPERKYTAIMEICKAKNYSLLTDPAELLNSKMKIKLSCKNCYNVWDVDYSSFVGNGRGCPKCAGQHRYSDEEYLDRISQVGKVNKFKFVEKVGQSKLRIHSFVKISCEICIGEWESSLGNLLTGKYSCPACARRGFNPVKRSLLYILKITDKSDNLLCYKYGISNVFKRRLENMRGINDDKNIVVVCTWGYEDGKLARRHENNIKKEFSMYMTKEKLKDGYTETVSPDKLLLLYSFQSGQYLSEEP